MKLIDALGYARREARGSAGRLVFFIACLAIGVGAVVAVSSLVGSIDQAIRSQARSLLAADIVVRGRSPLDAALLTRIDALPGVTRSMRQEMILPAAAPSSSLFTGVSTRAQVLVVDGPYPPYGQMTLSNGQSLQQTLEATSAVVAPALLEQLKLKEGDELRLGGASFRIAAVVLSDSSDLGWDLAVGPRVFINSAGLARTSLFTRLFRTSYQALLRLPEGHSRAELESAVEQLRAIVADNPSVRVDSYASAVPQLREPLRRVGVFLGLTALLSLLIGGIGVAQSVRAWIAGRMQAIAVLKCLGMRPVQVLMVYLGQAALLALIGSLVGAALGVGAQYALKGALARVVPASLIAPVQPGAIIAGIVLGVGIAVAFSLPALAQVMRIPPALVLRRDARPLPSAALTLSLCWLALMGAVYLAAWDRIGQPLHALWFTSFLLVSAMVLAGVAWAVSRLVGRLPRRWGGYWLRHGLTSLRRIGAGAIASIVAVGLGVMVVLGIHLTQTRLQEQLEGQIPQRAPSAFMLNIRPVELPELQRRLADLGGEDLETQPVYFARIASIDGLAAAELARRHADDEDMIGDIGREQRISVRSAVPEGDALLAGAWHQPGQRIGEAFPVSVAVELARDLRLNVGSRIDLTVGDRHVPLVVTSIRKVDWGALGISFLMLTTADALDGLDHQLLATVRLPAGVERRAQDEMARHFPMVNFIIVSEILDRVRTVLNDGAMAIRVLGWFAVSAGVIILGGAVSATALRRAREAALLKALGMRRRGVLGAFAVEYGLIGVVAALIGSIGAGVMDWAVATLALRTEFTLSAGPYAIALVLTALLTIAAGLATSIAPLRRPAWQTLRGE